VGPVVTDHREESAYGRLRGYLAGGAVIATVTVIGNALFGRAHLEDIVIVYVLGIVLVSMRWSLGAAVGTAIASILACDWFFVPPYHTFAIADPRHIVTLLIVGLIAVVVNRLTKRVRDQAATTHEAQRRVEAEQLRSSLLSSVSHDLRTPLAVITGTATTLLDPRLDPASRTELVEAIVQEADRLERLVRNLLDVTRVEAGALRVKKEWQPVEEVVGAALASVERVLGDRPIQTKLPAELLAPFDALLVQQVLVNLLENAAKYTDPASLIEITATRNDKEVEIVVADRGPGVPHGDETRIFEKFYRAEKGKGGGAGLGLTICRAIVIAHGGRMWADNGAEGGATFHFTLPLDGEPPAMEAESQRTPEEPRPA
jgi:two-component system sensor histidine kinase KdpD